MIKANELRTTNLVYTCKGGVETRAGMIAHGTVNTFEPIPLTEDWLLKFGFELAVDTWYFNGLALWFTEWGDENGNTGKGYFYELRGNGMMDKHIKYIHQLQNLYFALTGEELKLND